MVSHKIIYCCTINQYLYSLADLLMEVPTSMHSPSPTKSTMIFRNITVNYNANVFANVLLVTQLSNYRYLIFCDLQDKAASPWINICHSQPCRQ